MTQEMCALLALASMLFCSEMLSKVVYIFLPLDLLSGKYRSEKPMRGKRKITWRKTMAVMVPVSWGELIDKITILEIKRRHLSDGAQLGNVRKELEMLRAVRDSEFQDNTRLAELSAALEDINERLWRIEDDIRNCERQKDFGPGFVELARSVYVSNDERAALKKQINSLLGSELVEEKSYAAY
jgi:hypothetical protein